MQRPGTVVGVDDEAELPRATFGNGLVVFSRRAHNPACQVLFVVEMGFPCRKRFSQNETRNGGQTPISAMLGWFQRITKETHAIESR